MQIETLCSIFPEQSHEALAKLLDDEDFLKHLPSLILRRIRENKKIFPIDKEVLILLFSEAEFAEEGEIMKVSSLFRKYFSYEKRFLPLTVEFLDKTTELKRSGRLTERVYRQLGEDFASRCLFSLSFFYDSLKKLYERYGAPHPNFYRTAGERTFEVIGEERIAKNFENWEDYLREKAFA